MKANATSGCIPNPQWLRALLLLSLALALVVVLGIRQGRAAAESPPQLTNMAISVMPEYAAPRVMVSYRGELNADVSLPLEVSLRLPADANVEHACSVTPPDEHICQPFTATPDGQYLTLTYETTTPIMYVEVYYGSISGAGQRSLDFTFWPPYPVQNLDLIVKEPSEATDFTLSPAPAASVEDQGYRHHTYSFQDLPADDPVTIQMTYTRLTDQPSVLPRAAAAAPASDSGGIPKGVMVFVGLAGAAVLGLAFFSVLARRSRIRLFAFSREAPGQQDPVPQAATFFCRHCGGGVKQGFAFCPSCGQEVRLSPEEQQ